WSLGHARLPPELQAAAEEAAGGGVRRLPRLVVDELGRPDVADPLADEGEAVEIDRDALREAELEAEAALAAEVGVPRAELAAVADGGELRRRRVGADLRARDVRAADQVDLHAVARVEVDDAVERDRHLHPLEAVVVVAREHVGAQVEREVRD